MASKKEAEKKDQKKEEEVVVEEQKPNDKYFGTFTLFNHSLLFLELKKNLVLLEKASKDMDFKMTATLTKNLKKLRKMYELPDAVLVLSFYLPDLYMRLMLPTQPTSVPEGTKLEEYLHCTNERQEEIMKHAEPQLFLYDLLLMKLIDDGDYRNAKEFGDFIFARLKNVNLRTLDHLGAKAMYFIALANEKMGLLPNVRQLMFESFKTSCLRQDLIGQATITNVILRSYLSQNMYEQARQFVIKTNFPPNASNNQYARYLYYLGRIKAVQLEYSESHARLVQALRKSPDVGAKAFRIQVQKLQVIVELLMGEIPNRQIFSQSFLQKPLSPYFQVVNCVKSGDMETFKKILAQYEKIFKHDKNYSLILRLRHTVLKFGLKKLNISYSKISIKDIQTKLSLESIEETEQIVSKAIRDGVIDAVINHDEGFMQSREQSDVYESNDPQNMLNKRIKFCMDMH
jgi:26S proteasome regulatory subunit N3